MSDNPDWEYLYRQGEKTIDKRDARIAVLESKLAEYVRAMNIADGERDELRRKLTAASAELVVHRELRRTDNAAGAKLDQELRAELEKRDDFIDALYSESGIPTRHWRETITQYVADLRVPAHNDSTGYYTDGCRCSDCLIEK